MSPEVWVGKIFVFLWTLMFIGMGFFISVGQHDFIRAFSISFSYIFSQYLLRRLLGFQTLRISD